MAAKVAWVLGATGGIGRETCDRLTRAGWTVVASGRHTESLAELAAGNPHIHPLVCDVLEPDAVAAAHARLQEVHGPVAAVVHAVGSVVLRSLQATSSEQFRATIDLNLVSAFEVLRAAAPAMARQGGGRVVLFSSVAAGLGLPNHAAIAAAKAGVEALVRTAAADYARKGVRVNGIAPALTDTPLSAFLLRSEAGRQASAAMHPVGRIGQAGEIADVAAWLVDGAPDWLTGEVIAVDGGLGRLQAPAARPA